MSGQFKLKINDKFNNFSDFIQNIKSYFKENSQTIHKARNELKIINFNEIDTVVKAFKVPNIINQIVYSFFRDSKAKKSYEYSLKIKEFTPAPIGYIEFYDSGFFKESFFVSEKFDYDFTIREPLINEEFEDKKNVFKAFAKFTLQLHEAEIFHNDYSPGNILVKKEGDTYIFKVVDINRMKFGVLSQEQRMKNFSKLWAKDNDLTIMIEEYAALSKLNKDELVQKALHFNKKHKDRINMKKRARGIEVVD